jgi:hypothetical protein
MFVDGRPIWGGSRVFVSPHFFLQPSSAMGRGCRLPTGARRVCCCCCCRLIIGGSTKSELAAACLSPVRIVSQRRVSVDSSWHNNQPTCQPVSMMSRRGGAPPVVLNPLHRPTRVRRPYLVTNAEPQVPGTLPSCRGTFRVRPRFSQRASCIHLHRWHDPLAGRPADHGGCCCCCCSGADTSLPCRPRWALSRTVPARSAAADSATTSPGVGTSSGHTNAKTLPPTASRQCMCSR